jgi:diguanylate cyclase (GGDEF)-like protein
MTGDRTADTHQHADNDDLAAMTLTDALTGLANRRRFDLDLSTLSTRTHDHLHAIAVIEVDDFELFSNAHGHAAGDRALRAVAGAIAAAVPAEDAVYRYGEEAFGLILQVRSTAEAMSIVERARQAVASIDVDCLEGQTGAILSVSAGVGVMSGVSPRAALAAADAALYTAKQNGCNRVELAETGTSIGDRPIRRDSGSWDRSA